MKITQGLMDASILGTLQVFNDYTLIVRGKEKARFFYFYSELRNYYAVFPLLDENEELVELHRLITRELPDLLSSGEAYFCEHLTGYRLEKDNHVFYVGAYNDSGIVGGVIVPIPPIERWPTWRRNLHGTAECFGGLWRRETRLLRKGNKYIRSVIKENAEQREELIVGVHDGRIVHMSDPGVRPTIPLEDWPFDAECFESYKRISLCVYEPRMPAFMDFFPSEIVEELYILRPHDLPWISHFPNVHTVRLHYEPSSAGFDQLQQMPQLKRIEIIIQPERFEGIGEDQVRGKIESYLPEVSYRVYNWDVNRFDRECREG